MSQSELHIINKIKLAFREVESVDAELCYKSWTKIPDEWILSNSELFAYYSHPNDMFLLPAFMCYLLRNFRDSLNSPIYMYIEGTLGAYSKEKNERSFKYKVSNAQFSAIAAFIKHYLHNQPCNIDRDSWEKNHKRWVR